jgi:hypothetical protein
MKATERHRATVVVIPPTGSRVPHMIQIGIDLAGAEQTRISEQVAESGKSLDCNVAHAMGAERPESSRNSSAKNSMTACTFDETNCRDGWTAWIGRRTGSNS